MIHSLIEEAQAINWYEQRISVEKDKEAKAIMENAQKEEFIHFAMDPEFLLRKKINGERQLKIFCSSRVIFPRMQRRQRTRLNKTW